MMWGTLGTFCSVIFLDDTNNEMIVDKVRKFFDNLGQSAFLVPCNFNCAGTLIILVTILVGRFRSSGRSAIFTVKRSEKISRLRLATE